MTLLSQHRFVWQAPLDRLRSDAAARTVAIIDIEAIPLATSPEGSDVTALVGRWAALMQRLSPVSVKAGSGPIEEILVSAEDGEVIVNRLGDRHWLLLSIEESALLGRARHAVQEHMDNLLRRIT